MIPIPRPSLSALRWGTVALAVVIAPATVRGADIPLIRVFPPECPQTPVSIDDFVDSLRVELAGRQPHCCVVGPGGDGATDAVKVTLSIDPCEEATLDVGVRVDVAAPERTIERQVSLADLPAEARARALALAVAELMRGVAEPPPPVEVVPAPPPVQPPATPRLLLTGNVAGEVRRHFAHGTTLWGPRLGLALSRGRLQLTLDAGAAASNTQFDLGKVSILFASATLFAGPRFAIGPTIISFGPAGTFGWAWIKGQAGMLGVGEGKGSAPVAMVGGRAALEGPASQTLRLLGTVEAGWTARKVDAEVASQPAAGISGGYLMAAVGVRFGPSN
jgi:hypothetical protein